MAEARNGQKSGTPRVCLCVMMNHPFPAHVPLIRRLYAGRFSAIRFLIPFVESPDDDVITVYRGSYCHAGYLSDARRELAAVDCDHYMIVHDDVLLNPRLSEATFSEVFGLGPDDGFIPRISPLPEEAGSWGWYFGLIAKLLFPKSILFGSGVEPGTLLGYLPSAEHLTQAITACGITPTTHVRLTTDAMLGVEDSPSRVLIHGLAGALNYEAAAQHLIDAKGLTVACDLMSILFEYQALYRPETVDRATQRVRLPIPLVTAGYLTDFYILPKSGFERFCHYIGIASAANLFVEVLAPTLLYAVCGRVLTEVETKTDFSGFEQQPDFSWFEDLRAVAIHPYKLSRFADQGQADAFLARLAMIRDLPTLSGDRLVAARFGTPRALPYTGWHGGEGWGVWAAEKHVTVPVLMDQPGPVELALRAPLSDAFPAMHLTVAHGDLETQSFALDYLSSQVRVRLDSVQPDEDGIARITLTTDGLVVPAEVTPGASDRRSLGIGVEHVYLG